MIHFHCGRCDRGCLDDRADGRGHVRDRGHRTHPYRDHVCGHASDRASSQAPSQRSCWMNDRGRSRRVCDHDRVRGRVYELWSHDHGRGLGKVDHYARDGHDEPV